MRAPGLARGLTAAWAGERRGERRMAHGWGGSGVSEGGPLSRGRWRVANDEAVCLRFELDRPFTSALPSRTNWTRLVPPPVLTGHVSSLLPCRFTRRPAPASPSASPAAWRAPAPPMPMRVAAQAPCGAPERGTRRGGAGFSAGGVAGSLNEAATAKQLQRALRSELAERLSAWMGDAADGGVRAIDYAQLVSTGWPQPAAGGGKGVTIDVDFSPRTADGRLETRVSARRMADAVRSAMRAGEALPHPSAPSRFGPGAFRTQRSSTPPPPVLTGHVSSLLPY
jgi:hypothetical protein